MKERIILAPGLNGTELTRSLALHGRNCIGLRICGAAEFARLALMRSGVSIPEDFVNAGEEAAIIAKAAESEEYFCRFSYSDIRELAAAIRQMRSLVPAGDEAQTLRRILSKGIFKEKNAALFNVYQKYMEILSSKKALDAISLLRRAASESRVICADFLILEEYPLNPLEKTLLEKVSGGAFTTTNLKTLFGDGESGTQEAGTQEFRTQDPGMQEPGFEQHGTEEKPAQTVRTDCFCNCYGAPNEVEMILADIYAGKRLDQCTVAVTDATTYSQLFFDYSLLYDIPVTFGCGIPIVNSNPARLTALYYQWMTGGFFGAAAIREMLFSKAFHREKLLEQFPEMPGKFSRSTFFEVLGNLRLTNNRAENERRIAGFKKAVQEEAALVDGRDERANKNIRRKMLCIPCLEVMGRELALPAEDFIFKYAYIRRGSGTNARNLVMMLDLAASSAIYEELKVIRNSGIEQEADEIIPDILKRSVCTQRSEEGKLHITDIRGALAAVRGHLYIAGLSASKYPGSPRENPLLLDADLKLFGPGAEAFTADGTVLQKRNRLLTLARLASKLGAKVCVSYPGLNVSELKKDNPSSLVFELFREEHGSDATSGELEKHIRRIEYFEPAISASRLVGEAYTKGQEIRRSGRASDTPESGKNVRDERSGDTKPVPSPQSPGPAGAVQPAGSVSPDTERAWSPTALDKFFGCPRRFMLAYVLGIPEPEEYDPFEIMTALDTGTLAHSLMEELGGSSMSPEAFLELSGEYFDRFCEEHPPLIPENVPAVREQFLEMMETAYLMEPHREIVLEEEDIHCIHESGVRIHGFPDRVEKLEDGTYLIVDFKSGRKISHEQDDISTCLQIVIYAYLMEQKGFKVSGGEYRYIRLGETVTCRYDADMKDRLLERLTQFKECLESGFFPVAEAGENGDDPCRFCKYQSVCGRDTEREEAELKKAEREEAEQKEAVREAAEQKEAVREAAEQKEAEREAAEQKEAVRETAERRKAEQQDPQKTQEINRTEEGAAI